MSLPILLAGPIIRRAEPTRVCVWIATSVEPKGGTSVQIFDAYDRSQRDLADSNFETVQLGEHLWVSLIFGYPHGRSLDVSSSTDQQTFPTEKLLSYDISVVESANNRQSLDSLIEGRRLTIAYDPFKFPTFFLTNLAPLNFLHGSCRKPHAEGEDCLIAADNLLSETTKDIKPDPKKLSDRPSVLFLTGDQIYADDVAGPLLMHLAGFSTALLGWNEVIPIEEKSSSRTIRNDKRLSNMRAGLRKAVVRKHAQFTTDDGENHLIGFGEFAAMYLTVWNGENWPSKARLATMADTYGSKPALLRNLERSRDAMTAARRVLANIPTYMIFDDHEITDDWNLDRKWEVDVRASLTGRRIVANGLAAYWAFQAWGNNPGYFQPDFINTIKNYFNLQNKTKGKGGSGPDADKFDDRLWSFNHWHFVAPTTPPALFLDTRTKRGFDPNPRAAARLIDLRDESGVKMSYIDEIKRYGYQPGTPLLVVSPTPLIGVMAAKQYQEGELFRKEGKHGADLEMWYNNTFGLMDMMEFLAGLKPRYCIILSGDVHYAFTATCEFITQDSGGVDFRLMIYQLTSSPIKNETGNTRLTVPILLGWYKKIGDIAGWLRYDPSADIAWLSSQSSGWHHPVTSELFRILDDLTDPTLTALQRVSENLIVKAYFGSLAGLKSYLSKPPVILGRSIADHLRIQQRPTISISINYQHVRGSETSPLIGVNNIGHVIFDFKLHRLKHTLKIFLFQVAPGQRLIEQPFKFVKIQKNPWVLLNIKP